MLKNSIYDPGSDFIVSVYSPDHIDVFGVSPKEKELSVVRLTLPKRTPGRVTTQKDLGVASDANIVLAKSHDAIELAPLLSSLIWFHEGYKSNLTRYDMFRLLLTVGAITKSDTDEVKLKFSDTLDESEYKSYFVDNEVIEENVTIGIVNATGEAGIGRRMERVLSSLGCNVVSVTTSSKVEKTSSVRYTSQGATIKRIDRLLHFPMQQTMEQGVSDIIIVLGEDSLSKNVY